MRRLVDAVDVGDWRLQALDRPSARRLDRLARLRQDDAPVVLLRIHHPAGVVCREVMPDCRADGACGHDVTATTTGAKFQVAQRGNQGLGLLEMRSAA